MLRLKSTVVGALLTGIASAVSVTPSVADTITLPGANSTVDGIPVTLQYHDFYSYSAGLLDLWQKDGLLNTTSNYLFSTGTGTIAILPYTGAGGASNPSPFADPLPAPNGNQATSFSGTWDNDLVANKGTVGALLSFLQTNYNSSVPVFYFDNNQQSNTARQVNDLFAYGFVQIVDPQGNIKGTWCFDTGSGATCNSDSQHAVDVPGTISVTGTSNTTYTVASNTGSGKPDFFEYAPTLDLSLFDPNDIFEMYINLSNLNGGFEELGIVGANFPTPAVPEPASLALLGSGLLGLGWVSRRRKHR